MGLKAPHFTITSTAKNAAQWAARCIESVRSQTYEYWTHDYFAADTKTHDVARAVSGRAARTWVWEGPKPSLENLWPLWRSLPDDEVIVWLDGDDWFAHPYVLDRLAQVYTHQSEPWLTYGSFEFDRSPPGFRGKQGFAGPYAPGESFRSTTWRASHLKTFRAGLVKQLREEDLKKPDGTWADYCTDRVTMLPMLEMAGGHHAFIDEVLYVYNYSASFGALNRYNAAALSIEAAELNRIHAMPPYKPLEKRPW